MAVRHPAAPLRREASGRVTGSLRQIRHLLWHHLLNTRRSSDDGWESWTSLRLKARQTLHEHQAFCVQRPVSYHGKVPIDFLVRLFLMLISNKVIERFNSVVYYKLLMCEYWIASNINNINISKMNLFRSKKYSHTSLIFHTDMINVSMWYLSNDFSVWRKSWLLQLICVLNSQLRDFIRLFPVFNFSRRFLYTAIIYYINIFPLHVLLAEKVNQKDIKCYGSVLVSYF